MKEDITTLWERYIIIYNKSNSVGWEDPLEKEMAPTPVFMSRKCHGQRSLVGYSPRGHKRVGHDLATH